MKHFRTKHHQYLRKSKLLRHNSAQ